MPETLAGSAEFAKFCPFKNEDQADLMTLHRKLNAEGQMQKEKMKHLPNTVKANLLLHAYLTGVDCPPKLKDDQNMILSKSMHLIEAMLELSSQMRWLQTTKFIIQFSQLVTDAGPVGEGLRPVANPALHQSGSQARVVWEGQPRQDLRGLREDRT